MERFIWIPIGSHIKLDAEKSCIYIYGYGESVIANMKKILFREKILDEVYDKSEEYKNNLEKYEANTDDIIEKIEEKIPNRIICLLSNILLNMLLININKRFHNL